MTIQQFFDVHLIRWYVRVIFFLFDEQICSIGRAPLIDGCCWTFSIISSSKHCGFIHGVYGVALAGAGTS